VKPGVSAASFAAVGRLSPSEQRGLLESGDDAERLWSAWAIALHLGRDAVPILRSMESHELSEGLRRQLLVVLAGLGERQLLRAIADSEPSPSVGATASIYYLRTAPNQADPETLGFALEQLRKGPAEVRRAILAEQELGQVSLSVDHLLPSLRDADAAARVSCAACLLRDSANGASAQVVRSVVDAYAQEADADVRREFLARLPRTALPDLLDAVAQSDPSRLVDALETTRRQFGQLTWSDVRSSAPLANLEAMRTILAAVRPEAADGRAWLCRAIRIAAASDSRVAHEVTWRALHSVRPLLTEETVTSLAPADRELLRAAFQREHAERLEHMKRDVYDHEDYEKEYVRELRRLVQMLSAAG
jgi:hypothetical protein